MMYTFAQVLSYYGLIGDNIQDKIKVVCPFHEDVKPSMQVDVVADSFYCFGCGASGNAIKFVQQMEKCSEMEAMLLIGKIKKGAAKNSEIKIHIQKPMTSKEAIEEAKLYFYSLPKTDWAGADEDSYLFKRGYEAQVLNKLDVRENYNHIYGVIAPMLDMGEFKGYVCRATTQEFNGRDIDRKYLYNKGFSRRGTLVGNYDKPWPVITEGFLDYAKLVQFGVTNSCAILGWKITERQISKLQKYGTKIISALDNTPTGEEGTEYLSQYFDVVKFAFPEHRKDMGDMKEYEFNVAWRKTLDKIKSKDFI